MLRFFGGAPKNDERNYGQGWRPRIEITTAWDILQVGYGDFRNKEIFKYSSLNIGRVCYKEKSPFPRFK